MSGQAEISYSQEELLGLGAEDERPSYSMLEPLRRFPLQAGGAPVGLEEFTGNITSPAGVFLLLSAGLHESTTAIMYAQARAVLEAEYGALQPAQEKTLARTLRSATSYVLNHYPAGLVSRKAPVLNVTGQVQNPGLIWSVDSEQNGRYLAAALAYGLHIAPLFADPESCQLWKVLTGERSKTSNVPARSLELISEVVRNNGYAELAVPSGRIKDEHKNYFAARNWIEAGVAVFDDQGKLMVVNQQYLGVLKSFNERISYFITERDRLQGSPQMLAEWVRTDPTQTPTCMENSRKGAFRDALLLYNGLTSSGII